MVAKVSTHGIEGGRRRTAKESGVSGFSSVDGNFDILVDAVRGFCVLVSFVHDPVNGEEFWQKRFATSEQAMEYAEKI